MRRRLTALATTLVLLSCSPAASPQRCDGKADFVVSLVSPTDTFPSDTQVEVVFGGGSTEAFKLAGVNDPEVLFCETSSAPGPGSSEGGAGGAGGAPWAAGGFGHSGASSTTPGGASGSGDRPIHAITCEVWSGGPATITIRAASWHTTRELKADPEQCTLSKSIVLGEPDPKP